jgi:hypothetical protein
MTIVDTRDGTCFHDRIFKVLTCVLKHYACGLGCSSVLVLLAPQNKANYIWIFCVCVCVCVCVRTHMCLKHLSQYKVKAHIWGESSKWLRIV